jgi:plasmid maintenance system antidote protein VapI
MRLERVLGPSAGFWLNAQYAVDLYDAMRSPVAVRRAILQASADRAVAKKRGQRVGGQIFERLVRDHDDIAQRRQS